MMYSAITSGAKSAAGISLAVNTTWNFTTGINSQGLSAVDLGAAGKYVILAKPPSTITLLPLLQI
jgi:hypothetical protein